MVETNLVSRKDTDVSVVDSSSKQFVTMIIDGQLFGIPVLTVQDILRPQKITNIPLVSSEIMGTINLRGRIVTVINTRKRLGAADNDNSDSCMHVVVDNKGEQYSLVVDKVGEVLNLSLDDFESTPANLSSMWQDVSLGVYRLDKEIMVVLDIESMLKF